MRRKRGKIMVYYSDDNCIIRNLEKEDIPEIVREEIAQGWGSSDEKLMTRIKDEAEGRSIALVAEYDHRPVGYINVYFRPLGGPFVDKGYPEIVDFSVLEKCRRLGIGARLMDVAEEIAFGRSDIIYLGVGLHSGYGSAQRMYVKRGYLPDGSGVWFRDEVCKPYTDCRNDDDLVLYLYKKK